MGRTPRERAEDARQAKLDNVQEQVASGELVIRQMSRGEREKWAERDASLAPEERSRREAALKGRRQRAVRLQG